MSRICMLNAGSIINIYHCLVCIYMGERVPSLGDGLRMGKGYGVCGLLLIVR